MLATLGASTALAGFVLVFLGIIITRYESTIPGASSRVRERFLSPAGAVLGVFILGLSTVAVSLAWLAVHGGHSFYVVVIVLFGMQLFSTALISAYVTRGILLKR